MGRKLRVVDTTALSDCIPRATDHPAGPGAANAVLIDSVSHTEGAGRTLIPVTTRKPKSPERLSAKGRPDNGHAVVGEALAAGAFGAPGGGAGRLSPITALEGACFVLGALLVAAFA